RGVSDEAAEALEAFSGEGSDPAGDLYNRLLAGRLRPPIEESFRDFHTIMDFVLMHPERLEDLRKNAQGVEGFEFQRRIHRCLFDRNVIVTALNETPEYFISHAPLLTQRLREYATDSRYAARLFPMLYYAENVRQHIEMALQTEANEDKKQ